MNCPNCKRPVTTKKYEMFKCICGRVLMMIEVNKVKQITDVTPDKEAK